MTVSASPFVRSSKPAKPLPGGVEGRSRGEVRLSYAVIFESEPMSRIDMAVKGMPAAEAKRLLDVPVLNKGEVLSALGLPVATFNKKVKDSGRLSTAESERVLGFARLVGQVEAMVRGADGAEGFDARVWLARWLTEPLPALGNILPIGLLSTMEGQSVISTKLGQIETGTYA